MKPELRALSAEWLEINNRYRKELIKYLEEILAQNNNRLDWYELEDVYGPSILYDGGNHPEYASTIDNTVDGIFIEKGHIYLNTREDSEYSIDRVSTSEIDELVEFIEQNL